MTKVVEARRVVRMAVEGSEAATETVLVSSFWWADGRSSFMARVGAVTRAARRMRMERVGIW